MIERPIPLAPCGSIQKVLREEVGRRNESLLRTPKVPTPGPAGRCPAQLATAISDARRAESEIVSAMREVVPDATNPI
jgi:hypothetical protein